MDALVRVLRRSWPVFQHCPSSASPSQLLQALSLAHSHHIHTTSCEQPESRSSLSPGSADGEVSTSGYGNEGERERTSNAQAMELLRVALDEANEGEVLPVSRNDQRSLRVGIVGAPNAGKSKLTNYLVGSKVSAVSRKTNTTHKEHMGVVTKGETQMLFYDTPGLTVDVKGHPLRVDNKSRVRSAWQTAELCEALVVLVDAHRQVERRDKRVCRLVEKLGNEVTSSQKKVLCLNKVDLVTPKRLLLPVAEEFGQLPAFERVFMISGLTGSGMQDLEEYLIDQAVLRPWEEEADAAGSHQMARSTALEIVRQHIFDCLHKELPYRIEQQHISWKVLKDGSIRIQQLLLVEKEDHRKF